MKQKLLFLICFLGIGAFVLLRVSLAATGSLYISPETQNAQKGQSITVDVRINPGTDINGAGFELTYDPNRLKFASMSDDSSPFIYYLQEEVSAGKITLIKSTDGSSVSQDSLFSRLKFSVLASSGSITLNMNGNAALYDAYTNPTVLGARISIPNPSSSGETSPGTPSTQQPQSQTPQQPQGNPSSQNGGTATSQTSNASNDTAQQVVGQNIKPDKAFAAASATRQTQSVRNTIIAVCTTLIIFILMLYRRAQRQEHRVTTQVFVGSGHND
jgi:hypothetical protein